MVLRIFQQLTNMNQEHIKDSGRLKMKLLFTLIVDEFLKDGFANKKLREKTVARRSESESELCIYKQFENLISKKEKKNDYTAFMNPENREMA